MGKPKPKYLPKVKFTVEKDGFYGEYYEPETIRFPGKAMVVCSGSDGSLERRGFMKSECRSLPWCILHRSAVAGAFANGRPALSAVGINPSA